MADETKYERVDLPRELLDRARNMVAALRKQAPWLTLRSVLVEPVTNHIAQLERAFNGGDPFPPRDGSLTPGRRPIVDWSSFDWSSVDLERSDQEIADDLGVSRQTVELQRLKIGLRRDT